MDTESLPLFPDISCACLTCGALFEPQYKAQRYCSRRCYGRRNWTPEERACLACGTVFLQRWRTHRYCSQSCFSRHFVLQEEEIACANCGKLFQRRNYKQSCCSQKCHMRLRRSGPLNEAQCFQCGRTFIKVYRSTLYCSERCRTLPRTFWSLERLARESARHKREREQEKIRRRGKPHFKGRAISLNSNYKSTITSADLEGLMNGQAWHCILCNLHLEGNAWEIDHVIPVKSGGKTVIENLQILCSKCNKGKWTMSVEDYIAHCIAVADFTRLQRRQRQYRTSEMQLTFE